MIGFSVASAVVLAAGATALLTQSCAEPPPAKEPAATLPDVPPAPATAAGTAPTVPPSATVAPLPPPVAPPVT
jgi:hypothetical protein